MSWIEFGVEILKCDWDSCIIFIESGVGEDVKYYVLVILLDENGMFSDWNLFERDKIVEFFIEVLYGKWVCC